jgi:hypothetical protein
MILAKNKTMSLGSEADGVLRPLSVGNAVTAALHLYRFHFNHFLKQSAIAHLWILVPLYGWAKCLAKMGLLTRLAFAELIHQPEPIAVAQQKIDRLKWSFFSVFVQIFIGFFLFSLALVIAVSIPISVVMMSLIDQISLFDGTSFSATVLIPATIAIVISVLLILGALSWFYSRLIIADTPLAVDDEITGRKSIDRGWKLTGAASLRIQGMVMLAFLITLPIVLLSSYIPDLVMMISGIEVEEGSNLEGMIFISSFFTGLVGDVFTAPLWQSLKAVLYYDLRSRREGFNLNLQER